MRLYWTTTSELVKSSPEIFAYNLKAEGMFIGAPGTLIFRTKREAQEAIEKAKAEISRLEAERQKKRIEGFDQIFNGGDADV